MAHSNWQVTLIGICGGSGSGKTTLANSFIQRIGREQCSLLGQDSYYIDQSSRFDGDGGSINFDHPDSLDFALMALHLKELKLKKSVEVPIYDFATHKRLSKTAPLEARPFILVDGTLILSQPYIRQELQVSIFLDIAEDVRFQRRLKRDVHERGRHPDGVEKQFYRQVRPMHDQFVQPSLQYAQWILPNSPSYTSSVEEILSSLESNIP